MLRRLTTQQSKRNRRIRPTTSRTKAALVSVLGPTYIQGKRCADLYAGTGGVGIELLTRGAAYVAFVERDAWHAAGIEAELQRRNLLPRASVHRSDTIRWLRRSESDTFDIVFADPPYETTDLQELLNAIEVSDLLKPDTHIILEHSSRLNPPQPEPNANLILYRSRDYGDTSLTIYHVNRQTEPR